MEPPAIAIAGGSMCGPRVSSDARSQASSLPRLADG